MECCWTTTFILLILVYKFLDWLIRLFYLGSYDERYILITGCDTGFGNAIAKRLDKKGCHVIAGCLTEAGETDLKKTGSDRLQAISLDVSKPESVRRALDTVKGLLPRGKGLWAVLNNAGILGPAGVLESLSVDDYKKTASVNLYGLIDVTMTFLPLIKDSCGRVVNTSSSVGRIVIPVTTSYCVSKYGVEAFTDGLRRTLYPFSCKAMLVEPGMHLTDFTVRNNCIKWMSEPWNKADPAVREEYGADYFHHITQSGLDGLYKIATKTCDDVTDAYEHALLGRYPRARYVAGWDAKFIYIPLSWLPEWLTDWILRKFDPDCPTPAALIKKKQ